MNTTSRKCSIIFDEAELRRLIEAMKSYKYDKDDEILLERLRCCYRENFKADPSL